MIEGFVTCMGVMDLNSLASALRDMALDSGSVDASDLASDLKTSTAALSRAIREHGVELSGLLGVSRVRYVPGQYKRSSGAYPGYYKVAVVEVYR